MYSSEKAKLIALIILVAICVLILFESVFSMQRITPSDNKVSTEDVKNEIAKSFDALSLEAKAVYVFDISENKEIYSRNADAQLPLASLTKIMTALTASDMIIPNSLVQVGKVFEKREGNSGLVSGEKWKLEDLIGYTLTMSSNDGAKALASVAGSIDLGRKEIENGDSVGDFVSRMNEKAQKLGLNQTYFLNESGLDLGDNLAGAYGSARDVGEMIVYALKTHPEIFASTRYESTAINSLDENHVAINTNKFIHNIPNLIASKTGLTNLAGGNVAVAFDAGIGHRVVAIVLGSSETGRFADAEKLSWQAIEAINKNLRNEL